MKYLITEDRMRDTIKEFLKKMFPQVVSVSFSVKPVMLGSRNNEIIQRKVIEVIVDPYGILSGDSSTPYRVDILKLKNNIKEGLDVMFGLNLKEYGSKWEVSIFSLKKEII